VKIAIIGGGPAGLYLALLMKAQAAAHEITVVEQNAADATYGWGVVFSERALSFLAAADTGSYRDIAACLQTWDDQVIVHRRQPVRIDGLGFSGIARLELLRILQEHCRRRGVRLEMETRVTDLAPFQSADLLVGADGANSVVRQTDPGAFQSDIEVLSNKYLWYGTRRRFDNLTLTFRLTLDGAFVAHHYRYSETMSTFIVECDAATWEAAGLGAMSDDDGRRYCEDVFHEDLGGQPLLTNRSSWLSFKVVTNRRWSHDNVVLIGDALRTVHFSIGSGTRMALEDAIVLAGALGAHRDVPAALAEFERQRRPAVERYLSVAARSFVWYERMRDKLRLDPVPFAYDYVMRGGALSHERLRQRSPKLAAAWEAYRAGRSGPVAGPHEAQRP
jgi:2-polyprenyl-6-methoxyphenol hydroxylase-like FAD-dependent oxidoreductase